jgi:tRNA nucleotidyltransferase (CCA-adding enzyme)
VIHPVDVSDVAHLIDLVPADVLVICRRLREHGRRGWIVGGCVRDLLRGQPAKDWDVATDARPEEVMRIFPKVVPTGLQHGTVTVVLRHEHFEVTTLRGEGAYSDGRRPDKVEFVEDIVADLARRDFTINAMALDPVDGHLIDPFDGRKDLTAKVVRAVGDARERFFEDGLRILRGARFAATLEASIDPETERAMGEERSHQTFRRVSAERVRDEWMKSMKARRPSVAFYLMRRTGILDITCPELAATIGCIQDKRHAHDVWDHTMAVLDACDPDPILRIAALLHDIGKPRALASGSTIAHQEIGAALTEEITTRLRFSNEERAHLTALVRHHVIRYAATWSDGDVRRWIRQVSVPLLKDLHRLAIADLRGKGIDVSREIAALEELQERCRQLLAAGAVLSPKDLVLRGGEMMKILSIPPGPIVGEILQSLVEIAIEEPADNTRERLLEHARKLLVARQNVPQ